MLMFLKQHFRNYLLSRGKRIQPFADKNGMLDFIKLLKPSKTNYQLIRVGGNGDGGYLIPDDLEGIESCFSPGVSEIANFELELAEIGIACYLADYSVDGPPVKHELFDFEKKFLGQGESDVYILNP